MSVLNLSMKTQIGNAGVYSKQKTRIVTTKKNGHISIAWGYDLESQADLTTQAAADVKSETVCGVCLMPGESGMVLVY